MDDLPDSQLRECHFEHLRWALQALAAPADVQTRLFPEFVCKCDELMFEFDDAWQVTLQYTSQMGERQKKALTEVDAQLGRIDSDAFDEDAWWSGAALSINEKWAALRETANQALCAFGWPYETPPPCGATYVASAHQDTSAGDRQERDTLGPRPSTTG